MTALLPPRSRPRLVDRIEALGLTLLSVGPEGGVACASIGPWFDQALTQSAWFSRVLASKRGEWAGGPGCVELFPGVHVLSLGRATGTPEAPVFSLVLLMSRDVVDPENLQRLCDHAGLDRRATQTRIEAQRLMSAGEIRRTALTLGWMADDLEGLAVHQQEMRHLSEELATNYEELSLLYKLSANMSLGQSPQAFFKNACEELYEVGGLGWVSLQITEAQPRLQQLRGTSYTAGAIDPAKPVGRLGRELIERFAGQTQFIIIDDTAELGGAAEQVSASLLVVPLVRDGQTLGVLFGGDRVNGQYIDSVDAKLCASLCNTLSIFLENLMLLEDAQGMFMGTLHALTSAIDAKDSYTFGHSERVALLAEMLARAAGIDEETVERIYLAGLVHDVGKIGVPESVLCKPGRLTDEEFAMIKMHPAIGANMLRDIRQMEDLIPGVLYHHESWDGRGYPEKRAGLDIPLFGRIIGLADAFDAMSSDRTYRSALPIDSVLSEITRGKGSQFDPELAEVFLKLDFAPYFQMIQRHQAARRNDGGEARQKEEAA